MNIESLIEKIHLFDELIIDSGFRRDINDYIQSIQQSQNRNLVFMKDLSTRIKDILVNAENYSLGSELKVTLRDSVPFTELETVNQLEQIDNDTNLDAAQYFQTFSVILTQLLQGIDSNNTELGNALNFLEKYSARTKEVELIENQALMSLVFKDPKTTKSLKEFSKVVNRWNRTLNVYHTLVKSEAPDDVSLVEIQNGSIDIVFNINLDVAVDLAELITIGLKVYGAYLLYKSKRAREIIDSYMGNKKLIQMEKERETIMLDNIKESIASKALEQHTERLKTDKKIDKAGFDKKIDEVSTVITDHIIKGNEVKLLTPPKATDDDTDKKDLIKELKEESAIVKERYKQLSKDDKKLLLDKYSIQDEDQSDKKKG